MKRCFQTIGINEILFTNTETSKAVRCVMPFNINQWFWIPKSNINGSKTNDGIKYYSVSIDKNDKFKIWFQDKNKSGKKYSIDKEITGTKLIEVISSFNRQQEKKE